MFSTTFLIILALSQLFAKIVTCAPLPIPLPIPDNSDEINNSYSGAGGDASGGSVTTNPPNPNGLLGGTSLLNFASGRDSHDSGDRSKHAYHPTQTTQGTEAPQNLDPRSAQAPSILAVLGHPPLLTQTAALEPRHILPKSGTHILDQEASPKVEVSAKIRHC